MSQATQQRRSPTASQLRTWRTFVETSEVLRTSMSSRLQDESGLSAGDYAILLALSEAENKRMRSSALAEHIDWKRSRLSHHLGRMEGRGLIRREDCPTDNRGAEIVLTDAGASAFRLASAPHMHAIQELFVAALTPAQLDAVLDAMSALREHLERTHGTRPPSDSI